MRIGSYSALSLGPLYIGGEKGDVDPLVMMVFRESDKRICQISAEDPERADVLDVEGEPGEFDIVQYVALASVIRDRLEVLGYTLKASIRAFDLGARKRAREHANTMAEIAPSLPDDFIDTDGLALTGLSAERWMEAVREIRDRGFQVTFPADPALDSLTPLLRYMLGSQTDGWLGFPGNDIRHAIRLGVEVCPSDDLVYDLTDLVLGGYYASTDDVVAVADYLLTEDFAVTRRVVVLTEGSTDKWILERSLKLLYPHLADFYTFMDFDGARVAGGAPALAGMVQAFVGAGILNRVVALFDNDTAGTVAMRQLHPLRMPPNIVVRQFPPLPLASAYPTIGPTGDVRMDVNGLAGSIELYLGVDVLAVNGKFTAVQWKGLDESTRQYQGEVLGKSLLHDRFAAKLADCELHAERIGNYDWEGLRLILRSLQSVFHESDEVALVSAEENSE